MESTLFNFTEMVCLSRRLLKQFYLVFFYLFIFLHVGIWTLYIHKISKLFSYMLGFILTYFLMELLNHLNLRTGTGLRAELSVPKMLFKSGTSYLVWLFWEYVVTLLFPAILLQHSHPHDCSCFHTCSFRITLQNWSLRHRNLFHSTFHSRCIEGPIYLQNVTGLNRGIIQKLRY